MKKLLLIASFIISCSYTGYAQVADTTAEVTDTTASYFNSWFGVKGGINFSDVYGNDKAFLGNISGHSNFHVGVFAQIGWSERFAIRPELVYSRKGYERSDSVFRFDYLEVPILAVINITPNLNVHLGPQVNTMVSAKEEGKEVILENYNTFDYGAAAGLEGRIGRFIAGARYSLSFEKLIKKDNTGLTEDPEIHLKALQVYLAVAF